MSQIVRVKEVYDNGTCLVESPSRAVESCSGSCATCGACGSQGPVQQIAWNKIKAKPGDTVELENADDKLNKQYVMVYTVPPVLMIALAAIPVPNAIIQALLAFAGLIGGLLIAMAVINRKNARDAKNKVEYTIARIVE